MAKAPTLEYPVSMKKHGFHPDEFKDIIKSKAESLFKEIKGFKGIVDEVIKNFAIQETKDGKGDKRCRSTIEAQQHGSDAFSGTNTSPKKTEQNQPGTKNLWQEDLKNKQQKLFELMLKEGLLADVKIVKSEKGNLKWDDTQKYLSAVELCNTLDKVAMILAKTKVNKSKHDRYTDMEGDCTTILYKRIFVANAYDDDILTERGYKEWRKHLWMIASFGALLIGLKILLIKPVKVD